MAAAALTQACMEKRNRSYLWEIDLSATGSQTLAYRHRQYSQPTLATADLLVKICILSTVYNTYEK